MRSGRAAQTIVSEPSSATFAPNSVVCGAIRRTESRPIATAYARRAIRPSGTVFGSVIMKQRKMNTSGEKMRTCQK